MNVMLLYIGAEDCAPCRIWRNGEGAAFLASVESARVTYREVKSPHLEDVLKDENWPNDIRPFRDGVSRTDGVPLWVVVAGDEVVERQFGATAWELRVLPKIRSYLRSKSGSPGFGPDGGGVAAGLRGFDFRMTARPGAIAGNKTLKLCHFAYNDMRAADIDPD